MGTVGTSCGASTDPTPEPRLVILYATCSVNRDYLSPYNSAVGYTPNLGEFARDATVFLDHHTEAGISGVAYASIFAGTQAYRHKVYYHPKNLPDDLLLIPEAFADAGYETYFWSGHPVASAARGYGQGVPEANVIRSFPEPGSGRPLDRDVLTANDARFDALLTDLKEHEDKRAYVQINFTLTHDPYRQSVSTEAFEAFLTQRPELLGSLTREEIDRYWKVFAQNRLGFQYDFPATVTRLGMSRQDVNRLAQVMEFCYRVAISELDRYFGEFLDRVRASGLYEQSLIVFTSDHGEILHRENALFHWTHGRQLAPEVLRVPLIVRSPYVEVPAGTHPEVTRSIDLLPTLTALCGVKLPEGHGIDGVDLSGAIRGREDRPQLRAFCHSALLSPVELERHPGPTLRNRLFPRRDPELIWTLVREGDLACKLRRSIKGDWKYRIYDWNKDPGETRNLYDPTIPKHAALAEAAEAYKRILVANYTSEGESSEAVPEAEELDALRALGYVR